ncbi:hypothetical protein FQN49_001383 [Arthroderma sp. PD_2]|nr:hypothetical protein FQN49_001383 [Arthroderma sp. PD_2]
MDKPVGELFRSKTFKFYIGPEKTVFTVHGDAVAKRSPALHALINNNMAEANSGTVSWPDVDEDTFIRFCEFCYFEDYSPPNYESPCPATIGKIRYLSVPISKKAGHKLDDLLSDNNYPPTDCRKQFAGRFGTTTRYLGMGTDRVLLGHARLYVIADKYGVSRLKGLVLYKLYKALNSVVLISMEIQNIIKLIRFAYNDDNTRKRVQGIDELRKLVTRFAVSIVVHIGANAAFLELLQEGGDFVVDFWKVVWAKRISLLPQANSSTPSLFTRPG